MALKLVSVLWALAQFASAAVLPATLLDLEIADDTMSVGSYVREVRAAAPYEKSYQNEGDGEVGYSRKKSGGGKRGYQHFDTFHKKAGDNYEFVHADSFGHDDDGEAGAHSHQHEQRAQPSSRHYHKDQPKKNRQAARHAAPYERYDLPAQPSSTHYQHDQPKRDRHPATHERDEDAAPYERYEQADANESVEDEEEPTKNEKHDGPHHEELKDGASDGNGGIEAYGHNPDDYELPQKYTVLTEDDYTHSK